MSSQWQAVCKLSELTPGEGRVFKAAGKQAAVFRLDEERVYAVDNRCPHEGYPLSEGTIKDCVLTCSWHNYKFDLRDGQCVMGEEDVRSYPVRIEDEHVELDFSDPDPSVSVPPLIESLEQGLEEHAMGRAARDVVRLLQLGVSVADIALIGARFDAERAEYGSTHALPVACDVLAFMDSFEDLDAAYPLMQLMDLASEPNMRLPERATPQPLEELPDHETACLRLRELVEEEETLEAEALLRGMLQAGATREEIEPVLYRICADHFLDFGHALIYQVKVFDLLDKVGWQHAEDLLPAHLFRMVNGTREDLLPDWTQFRERLHAIKPRFEELLQRQGQPAGQPVVMSELVAVVLDGTPTEMFQALTEALELGSPLELIVNALSQAAAERLLRFDCRHDADIDLQAGWLDVTHLLTFVNALRHATERFQEPELLNFVFYAGRFVSNAKTLDLQPGERIATDAISSEDTTQAKLEQLLVAMAEYQDAEAVGLLVEYLESGESIADLRASLVEPVILDPAVRAIVVAHVIKMTVAAFEEHTALESEPRPLALPALIRFLASPIVERRIAQRTHEAINFVGRGQKPRTIT